MLTKITQSTILTLTIVFLLFGQTACSDKITYVNKSGNCRLYLHSDNTYKLIYPLLFWGKVREKGTFEKSSNSIVLKRQSKSTFDSLDYSSSYEVTNPKSLILSFKTINDSIVNSNVTFNINKNPKVFKTDLLGEVELLYSELKADKIISNDSSLYSMVIFYKNKTFYLNDSLIKPTGIDFKLNQYIGEKRTTLYKIVDYSNDTLFVHGLDPKVVNGRLTRK